MARTATVHELRSSNSKNGSDKYSTIGEHQRRGAMGWRDAPAEDLLECVATVTEDGAALLLSVTSDGGALVMQVWNGAGRHKLYPATPAELNEALRLVTDIARGVE